VKTEQAITATDKTHLANILGNQHAWYLDVAIDSIQQDICH